MAISVAKPLFMSETDLLIEADDFAAEVSSVTMTPSSSTQSTRGLKKGASFTATTAPTWKVDIVFSQNWDSDSSLSVYLFKNQGRTVTMTFRPKSGGRTWTAKVQITPGAVGGAVDAYATATVSLGMEGDPVLGAVVPAV